MPAGGNSLTNPRVHHTPLRRPPKSHLFLPKRHLTQQENTTANCESHKSQLCRSPCRESNSKLVLEGLGVFREGGGSCSGLNRAGRPGSASVHSQLEGISDSSGGCSRPGRREPFAPCSSLPGKEGQAKELSCSEGNGLLRSTHKRNAF